MNKRTGLGFIAAIVLAVVSGRTLAADGPIAALPWLHEGMVITYTWYSAVAPGNGSDYQEDANGDWVNSATGQHYTRSTQHGTSGSGWNQTTIAGIEKDRVVIATQSFGDAGALGNGVPVPLPGAVSAVVGWDQFSDFWMDPARLSTLKTDGASGTLITSAAWKSGDKTVDAIKVQLISGSSYSLRVYDSKTGQCLHYATSIRGASPKLVGPGDMGAGDVALSHGDLVGMRDLALPWAKEPMPDWVAGVNALHYRGMVTTKGALPTVPNEVTVDLTLASHGKNWAVFDSVANMRMQGAPETPANKSQIASGRAQIGGLWIGPSVMGDFQQGQVIDDDPVTKMQTVVSKISDDSIVISQQSAGGEMDSQYDRGTGMLMGSGFVNVLAQQQITVRLQSRE